METWYLLFGGSSADGRGAGRYEGRTTDANVALAHFRKIARDPYSTGHVEIITDAGCHAAMRESDFRNLTQTLNARRV